MWGYNIPTGSARVQHPRGVKGQSPLGIPALSAARKTVFERETSYSNTLCQAVRHKCVLTHPPYEERIGTKEDGVELLAGASVQARTKVFAPEHFCPVPVVPEFAHTIRTTA